MRRDTVTITDDEQKAKPAASKFGVQKAPEVMRETATPTHREEQAQQQRSKFGAVNRPIY
jgi:hypothetical protein